MNRAIIKTLALVVTLTTAIPTVSAITVHDPKQTAATILQLKAQLEEWVEQHAKMNVLNDLNTKIRDYQQQLNDIVGLPDQAVKAIVDAKQLLDRLKKFDQIEDILDLESEIAKLENLTDALANKKDVFGELNTKVGDFDIARNEVAYKRHVLTNKRVDAYEKERNTTATELDGVASQLATAQEKASKATTESEQLAALIELQAINAQLRMMALRLDIRTNDVTTHAIAVSDREMMEQKNREDAFRVMNSEFYEGNNTRWRDRELRTLNFSRTQRGLEPLTELPAPIQTPDADDE